MLARLRGLPRLLHRPASGVIAALGVSAVAALAGAVFLIAADIVSRMLIPGQVVPIGVVTALVGAPGFAIILIRNRARA